MKTELKKTVLRELVIDAIKFDGTNFLEVLDWLGDDESITLFKNEDGQLAIRFYDGVIGNVSVQKGDWILRHRDKYNNVRMSLASDASIDDLRKDGWE